MENQKTIVGNCKLSKKEKNGGPNFRRRKMEDRKHGTINRRETN